MCALTWCPIGLACLQVGIALQRAGKYAEAADMLRVVARVEKSVHGPRSRMYGADCRGAHPSQGFVLCVCFYSLFFGPPPPHPFFLCVFFLGTLAPADCLRRLSSLLRRS